MKFMPAYERGTDDLDAVGVVAGRPMWCPPRPMHDTSTRCCRAPVAHVAAHDLVRRVEPSSGAGPLSGSARRHVE